MHITLFSSRVSRRSFCAAAASAFTSGSTSNNIKLHVRYLLIAGFIMLFLPACNNRKTANSHSSDAIIESVISDAARDTLIISERIDGPANIRNDINGKVVFILNDNVPVTTLPDGRWLQVGLFADLNQKEFDSACIQKGSKIIVNGKEVGRAMEKLNIEVFKSSDGLQGSLVGYTYISNIKPSTIPENALAEIINENPTPITHNDLEQFIRDFKLNPYNGLVKELKSYEIDES